MPTHGKSYIRCSDDDSNSSDDCHHFPFWGQTGAWQSSSGDSEETGLCVAEHDRVGLGLGWASTPAGATQGPSQANVTFSTLYLWLLLTYFPSWNFYFLRGNPAFANNATILQGPAVPQSICMSVGGTRSLSLTLFRDGTGRERQRTGTGHCGDVQEPLEPLPTSSPGLPSLAG